MKKYVYLGGPINGCSDEEANGWRDDAKTLLHEHYLGWIDPMDRDYRGREMEPGIAEAIVENDKRDIESSDIVLANCPKPSVGTSMEVYHAWLKNIPVIAVIPLGATPSPWLVYHSRSVVEGSVLTAIREEIL